MLLSDTSRRSVADHLQRVLCPDLPSAEHEHAAMARALGDDPDDTSPAGMRGYLAQHFILLNEYWEDAIPDQDGDDNPPETQTSFDHQGGRDG